MTGDYRWDLMSAIDAEDSRARAAGHIHGGRGIDGRAYLEQFPNSWGEILSCDPRWRHNGDLVWAMAQLGMVDGEVLDLTAGRLVFWKSYRPERLTLNDLFVFNDEIGYHEDYTDLPDGWTDQYNTVFYDPKYKLAGSPQVQDFNIRYGVVDPAKLPARMWDVVAGLAEAKRVSKRWVHVKCQNQVAHHRYRDQVAEVVQAMAAIGGMTLVAEWTFVNSHPQPQPQYKPNGDWNPRRRARNNTSTMLSFLKGTP